MLSIALALHLLATVIWVGGIFFAHMAMRPALEQMLEPPQRLPLLRGILGRFFPWVWLSLSVLLVTGYGIFLGLWRGKAGLHVHLMQGTGLVMIGLFVFLYFVPYRRLGAALEQGDIPRAGKQMTIMRRIIATNLVLGLLTSILGVARPF
jgi:uncharacterized membrane protein